MAMASPHLVRHQALYTEFPGDAVLVHEEIHHDARLHQQVRNEHKQCDETQSAHPGTKLRWLIFLLKTSIMGTHRQA